MDCVYSPSFEATLGHGLLLLIFNLVHDLHSFEVNHIGLNGFGLIESWPVSSLDSLTILKALFYRMSIGSLFVLYVFPPNFHTVAHV